MKFTKTLVISLLALGAMQFAMAEPINIDDKTNLTLQPKGDTVDLQLTVCEGSCGEELLPIQAPEYLTYTKSKTKVDRAHNLYTISLKFNNTPSDKPLIISTVLPDGTVKSHTITFKAPIETAIPVQILPAEKPVKQVIDVDLTKKTGAINLIEMVQAAENNKAFFEPGDIIHLVLSENPTTGYQLLLPTELPKYLKILCNQSEAPAKVMKFNSTSCQMEPVLMTGAPSKRHLVMQITSLNELTSNEFTKPLVISNARSWEAERPATYTLNFALLTPAPKIVQATPEKERALGSKFTTPKKR